MMQPTINIWEFQSISHFLPSNCSRYSAQTIRSVRINGVSEFRTATDDRFQERDKLNTMVIALPDILCRTEPPITQWLSLIDRFSWRLKFLVPMTDWNIKQTVSTATQHSWEQKQTILASCGQIYILWFQHPSVNYSGYPRQSKSCSHDAFCMKVALKY